MYTYYIYTYLYKNKLNHSYLNIICNMYSRFCDTYKYMSNYTRVYIQLYE